MKEVIEDWPYDTPPIIMEECLNEKLDNEDRNNWIEKNNTKLDDEGGDDTEVNDKEGYGTTDTEILSSE